MAEIEVVGDKVPAKSTWEAAYRFMLSVNNSLIRQRGTTPSGEPEELRCWMHP